MDRSRRSVLKNTLATLYGLVASRNAWGQEKGSGVLERIDRLLKGEAVGQMSDSEIKQKMQRAREEEAREVEQLYSTKPVRVRLGDRQYLIPVNYLTPKGKNYEDTLNYRHLPFSLFLPDYGGFTKENWQKGWFDRRRIDVVELKQVDKTAIVPHTELGSAVIQPAGYGEPRARFENRRKSLEAKPSFREYGLEGYLRKNKTRGATWTGTRTNGEFFFFEASLAPGQEAPFPDYKPLCDVRYYSEKEDLYISYRYFQEHISKWREIDDSVWRKIGDWKVR